jgi:hypothetical protein
VTMISQPVGTLPVRTLERVPAETIQMWVQFAYTANTPAAFGVLADVFFALSWEIRAQDEWLSVEQAMTRLYANVPFWMSMYIHSTDYAVNDWRNVVEVLTRVVDKQGIAEFAGWRDFAVNHVEQLAQSAEQMFHVVLSYCEHNGVKLPTEYMEERLARHLEGQAVAAQGQ